MNSHDVDAALNADPNGWREPWRKHTSVLQEYVQELREYIAELLQQTDTNVQQPQPDTKATREELVEALRDIRSYEWMVQVPTWVNSQSEREAAVERIIDILSREQ